MRPCGYSRVWMLAKTWCARSGEGGIWSVLTFHRTMLSAPVWRVAWMDKSSVQAALETGQTPALGKRRLAPRTYGPVNWLGLWTLYLKEVRRFMKVAMQTVLAPVVSTRLFTMDVSLAVGQTRGDGLGVRYNDFVAPGLIMPALLPNAFANSSLYLVQAKLMGSSVDFLISRLSPGKLTAALLAWAVTRRHARGDRGAGDPCGLRVVR